MDIIPVKSVDEVLKIALTKNLKRVEWVEVEQFQKINQKKRLKALINNQYLYQHYMLLSKFYN